MHIVTWTSRQLAHSSKNYRKTEKSRTGRYLPTPEASAFFAFAIFSAKDFMPKKPYHSVKFDAFFYTFNFFTKEPLFLLLVEANLFLAIFKYSILLSIPTNFRFCFLHTTPVVPLPQNGSKTRSPVLLGRGRGKPPWK